MAITVGGTSITFNDGTTQSTAAGAPTTAQVLNATAGASVGAVGSYATLSKPSSSSSVVTPGTTIAGSSLRYSGGFAVGSSTISAGVSATAPAGTWRCMGYVNDKYNCCGTVGMSTLFLRIS